MVPRMGLPSVSGVAWSAVSLGSRSSLPSSGMARAVSRYGWSGFSNSRTHLPSTLRSAPSTLTKHSLSQATLFSRSGSLTAPSLERWSTRSVPGLVPGSTTDSIRSSFSTPLSSKRTSDGRGGRTT